ncbi:hypothetical protein D3C76_573860 [compost metagenome]
MAGVAKTLQLLTLHLIRLGQISRRIPRAGSEVIFETQKQIPVFRGCQQAAIFKCNSPVQVFGFFVVKAIFPNLRIEVVN